MSQMKLPVCILTFIGLSGLLWAIGIAYAILHL